MCVAVLYYAALSQISGQSLLQDVGYADSQWFAEKSFESDILLHLFSKRNEREGVVVKRYVRDSFMGENLSILTRKNPCKEPPWLAFAFLLIAVHTLLESIVHCNYIHHMNRHRDVIITLSSYFIEIQLRQFKCPLELQLYIAPSLLDIIHLNRLNKWMSITLLFV